MLSPTERLNLMNDRSHELWIANQQALAAEWYADQGDHENAAERRAALERTRARIAAIEDMLDGKR